MKRCLYVKSAVEFSLVDANFSTSISRFRCIIKMLSTWKCLDIQKEMITMKTIIIISLYLDLSL